MKNAEQATVIKAEQNDNRVISGLGWIRKTRLDELPQFINVVKGDMSIVGLDLNDRTLLLSMSRLFLAMADGTIFHQELQDLRK